jgi:hypothetical protein
MVLAAAWVASLFMNPRVLWPWPGGGVGTASFEFGSLIIFHDPDDRLGQILIVRYPRFPQPKSGLGEIDYSARPPGWPSFNWLVACPIAVVLTLLAPLAVGTFNRFRFPLWMWFAWTALIASECAFYLPRTSVLLAQ